jgi:serine/threonine-protein kinase
MDWEVFYNRFREPDFIAGYEIQNRLGGGAFGEVYKARKASIGKAYAIKFLKIDDDAQREAVERELEQVRHFAAIDHPNLVTIEDLGTVNGVPYLIMGYAGEDTLARALKSGRLDPRAAFLYFVQACRGVLALHDRRLVHFDLKPSNIFIKGDIARVGDYGLSKMMTDGRLTLSFGRGTPQYMAPEMLKNRADHRADLYSLGVILFESLSSKLPFESGVPGTISMREDDRPPSFPPDFPAPMRHAVERCLRLSPEDRYANVGELLEDLGQTARPGDSVRLDGGRSAAPPIDPRLVRAPSTPTGERASTRTEARQTAAELTRGAVEVARGVWDGLRNMRSGPRTASSTRPGSSSSPGSSSPLGPKSRSEPDALSAPPSSAPDARGGAQLTTGHARPAANAWTASGTDAPAHATPPPAARIDERSRPDALTSATSTETPFARPDLRRESEPPLANAAALDRAHELARTPTSPTAARTNTARPTSASNIEPITPPRALTRETTPAADAVVMYSLAEGSAPFTSAAAGAVPPVIGMGGVGLPLAMLETIPVPPAGQGGWIGTLRSSLALAVEVLVSLIRGLVRRVSGRTARNAAHTIGAGFLRILRVLGFILLLAIVGGLVTWIAILLWKGSP